MLCAALLVEFMLSATGNALARHEHAGAVRVFSDGSRGLTRRVFAYRQQDGVQAFTDRAPVNQRYEVMEFACYACNPGSRIDWRSTALHADEYNSEIAAAATSYGVDAALIRAVMHAESGFNPYARSRKGAIIRLSCELAS